MYYPLALTPRYARLYTCFISFIRSKRDNALQYIVLVPHTLFYNLTCYFGLRCRDGADQEVCCIHSCHRENSVALQMNGDNCVNKKLRVTFQTISTVPFGIIEDPTNA